MNTLLLVDHNGRSITASTAKLLSAAVQLGGEVSALVVAEAPDEVAKQVACLNGVSKVLTVEGDGRVAETVADISVKLMHQYDRFVALANTLGKSAAPRVAALLDVSQISEITAVLGSNRFERPIYAGNAIETVESHQEKDVITVRASVFVSAGEQESAPINPAAIMIDEPKTQFVQSHIEESARPALSDADVVVAGGVSIGSAQGFSEVVEPLADKLNAAVGASRAAVDAGYIANDAQVGQTGKVIAPDLYIGCGISGAIQHVAGIKGAKTIIAINSDPEAPIFQHADVGYVGDIFDVVPALISKL